jgi:hypothetical protein
MAVQRQKFTPSVTKGDYEVLTNPRRNHRMVWEPCTLRRVDDQFVMEGPSGKHTLAIQFTKRDRLNAHWKAFALSEANARVKA